MKTNMYFLSYLAQFVLEWEMFQTKIVEKIKTQILRSVTFFNRAIFEIKVKVKVSRDRLRWPKGFRVS